MEVFLVYLWLKLDSLRFFLCVTFFICVLGWFVYGISLSDCHFDKDKNEHRNKWWPVTKKTLISGVLCLIISLLMPSSQQTAILVGTHYAVDLAKSPEGAKVFSLIRKKANDYLDEQLKPEPKPQK